MAKKNDKIAFGTAFRGYRKADVNEFIERKAADFARKEEEFDSLLRQKDEKITEALAENARLAEILAESDKVIMEQKAAIEDLEAYVTELQNALEEKDIAFATLNAEVDNMSAKIALLIEEQEKAAEAPKEKKEFPKVRLERKSEPKAEPKVKATETDSVSNALKAIQNKILSFLK